MIELLLLPFLISTLIIYIINHFISPTFLSSLISFSLSTIIYYFLLRGRFRSQLVELKTFLWRKNLILSFIIIFFFALSLAWVLSPLVQTIKLGGIDFFQFPGPWDYAKHLYSITAINLGTLPPQMPFFPSVTMHYYYGYYLIPAALSLLLYLPQTTIIYAYVILTDTIGLLLLLKLFSHFIQSPLLKALALSIVIFSTGWDIIPITLFRIEGFSHHIELWTQIYKVGLTVYNTYNALLWTPQHFLSAIVTLVMVYYLIFLKKQSVVFFILCYIYVALSSLFILIILNFWLLLIFIFYPKSRFFLFKIGFFSGLLLIPYVHESLGKGNILSFYSINPFPFVKSPYFLLSQLINLILTFISEYGPLIFILPFLFFWKNKNLKQKAFPLILGLSIPILVTWFIHSSEPNDFAMKLILPIQLCLAGIYVMAVEKTKNIFWKIVLLILIFLTLLFSGLGYTYEFYYRWKERKVLDFPTSQLISSVRNLDPKYSIAVITPDEWTFYLPSLAFHSLYSPYLFDSVTYLGQNNPQNQFTQYEQQTNLLINKPDVAPNLTSLISLRNTNFKELSIFFESYPFDGLLVNNFIDVKEGRNPWKDIFSKIGTESTNLTSNFTLYNRKSLVQQLRNQNIAIDYNQILTLIPKDRTFKLTAGIWYLAICPEGKNEENRHVALDLEDFYSVIGDTSLPVDSCVGNLFSLDQDKNILLSLQAKNIQKIYALPVKNVMIIKDFKNE